MVSASSDDGDFAADCREAFVRHCQERDKIDPTRGAGQRELNAERRARLVDSIDGVLDQYLDWLDLSEGVGRLSV
jgi:hypothetical protein